MKIATPACLAQMPVSAAAMIARYREARSNLWSGPPEKSEPLPPPPPRRTLHPAVAYRLTQRGEAIAETIAVKAALLTPREQTKRLTVKLIVRAVARYYDLPTHDLMSARRTANIVRPRQVAMWLSKRLLLASLPHIGRAIGGRDHTTVLHGVRKIDRLRFEDPQMAEDVQQLEAELRPPEEEEAHGEGEERRRPDQDAQGIGDDRSGGAGDDDRAAQRRPAAGAVLPTQAEAQGAARQEEDRS